ncbi:acyl-CoA thioester hydrolase [Quadrisphaera granulorum]|uniref:Acyl-CoA thioester hydrolase n=1 Tax=Quadrisphaera granulorum TaxID=317664 RepID=A0A315ZPA2_9ACTN|nr:thioesterase family protein [Quadrisphaera granulorum]PWJ47381.1 acyl-CoA thioester hydrolase [Quadrisphaera granulorum]SZE98828.1 acyl-CoA thioester hydrolase [Quadrisphaera granulorum]
MTVRWSDMDAFGHVNNVQVLRLLEEVRVHAFEDLRDHGGPSLLESGVVVARHEVEYLAPLVWRLAPVPADIWITAVGGASFEVGYEIYDDDESAGSPGAGGERTVYVRAATTCVAYDLATGSARRLGTVEREVLESWIDEPVPFRRRSR